MANISNECIKVQMGALYSLLWGSPEDPNLDVPDKTTGITPRERREVATTWALVKKDIKGNGETLLIQFFKSYPEHQKRFGAFKDLPVSQLKGNKKLQAHANSVMYAVSAVVDNLADPECLVEMLVKLGANHARNKVPEQGFKDLKVVLIDLLKTKLGSKLSPQGEAAWDKTLDVAYSVIFKGMADYEAQQNAT